MTQLWSDEKIDGLSVAFMKDDLASKWIHKTIATDMRNDYERALSFRNETIGNLQGELRDMQARNAALETELIEAATKADYWRGEHDTAAFQLQDARAAIAELDAQLQALGVVVNGQNRKLKILLAAAAARGDGFGPVPANPTDGMSYLERQALLNTDINEV
jgi:septal ring factor EnvC (AmiA/AmiB activator)